MRAAHAWLFALPALAVLGACGRSPTHVPASELSGEWLWVIRTAADGTPTQVLADNPVARDALSDRVELDKATERLVVVALNEDVLAEVHPGYLPEQTNLARLWIGDRPEDPILRLETVREPLPDGASVVVFDAETETFSEASAPFLSRLRASLQLELRVDHEYCALPGNPEFEPFASELAFVDSECASEIANVSWLPDGRVLARSQNRLFVVSRGENFDCLAVSAQGHTSSVRLPGLRDMAFDPRPTPEGAYPVALMTRKGQIAETLVWPDGFDLVRTTTVVNATITPSIIRNATFEFLDIEYDSEGRTIVAGSEGYVLVRENRQSEFVAIKLDTLPIGVGTADIRKILVRPDPSTPHTLISPGRIFYGNAVTNTWRAEPVLADGESFDILIAGQTGTGANIDRWFSGEHLRLTRIFRARGDERPAEAQLTFPPSINSCLDSGFTRPLGARALAVDDEAVYLAADCNAVLRIRRSDSCVVPIRTLASSIIISPNDDRFRAIASNGSSVVLGATQRRLFVLDVR